jgi:two-component system sensor histidine kinase UhpB
MNLKLRLNLIITLLLLVIIVMGAVSTIHNARQNVQAEIASTAVLAIHMLDAEVMLYSSGSGWASRAEIAETSIFHLAKLHNVRHLKIEFFNLEGKLIDSNAHNSRDQTPVAPQWFVTLMDSVTDSMKPTRREVFKAGEVIGELVVTPDPLNEIDEVWEETQTMLVLLTFFIVIANILIYIAVNQALKPIDKIISALTAIEMGNLSSRLPKFTLPELSSISDKFNVMAETLEKSTADNHNLTQQIIHLQEDERKNLARELHDEIGQHLTAIHIDASAILNAKTTESAHESAKAIDSVTRQMMDIVHTMLQRLRPSGLDELGLKPALEELVSSWSHRQKGVHIDFNINGDFTSIDEVILLTIYRVIQECLTNISRHSQAKDVVINLEKEAPFIKLYVADNGVGFAEDHKTTGFGLAGMNERIDSLGGEVLISSEPNKGVAIVATIPYEISRRG